MQKRQVISTSNCFSFETSLLVQQKDSVCFILTGFIWLTENLKWDNSNSWLVNTLPFLYIYLMKSTALTSQLEFCLVFLFSLCTTNFQNLIKIWRFCYFFKVSISLEMKFIIFDTLLTQMLWNHVFLKWILEITERQKAQWKLFIWFRYLIINAVVSLFFWHRAFKVLKKRVIKTVGCLIWLV